MPKPLIFMSHVHDDGLISTALEELIQRALLGGVEIFNSSNRAVVPGEPWRDSIIQSLQRCAAALVIATPQSVTSPWVSFESGGAWVAGKHVIPCCAGGMKRSSLPTPLNHLQALELDDPEQLRNLIDFLAGSAGLNNPQNIDYADECARLVKSWSTHRDTDKDEDLVKWLRNTQLRARKYKGDTKKGTFIVRHVSEASADEEEQLPDVRAHDSLKCRIAHPSWDYKSLDYCFVNGPDADRLEGLTFPVRLQVDLKCLGPFRVYDSNQINFTYADERIYEYHPAYLLEGVTPEDD
ncbi:TIR domain-containing protein [Streptomyces sp. NPDC051133]|uniref:TIR domain-containing protein n=1 Tax=Streptomyces sp. NPDC051133 TaxID=3155521 RepID=UPI0034373594